MTNRKVVSNMGGDEITYKCLCNATAGKVVGFFELLITREGKRILLLDAYLRQDFF